jgi:biopolymer transport protein ExbD
MGMSLGGNGKQKAEMNMTPMIDVLLVLIIIFMVIIPTKSIGLHALLPQEPTSVDPQEPQVSHDIVITVHRDGSVDLNRETLDIPRLRERLLGIFSQQGVINVVFVKGDRDLDFSSIAEVIDLTRGSGVQRIALMPN